MPNTETLFLKNQGFVNRMLVSQYLGSSCYTIDFNNWAYSEDEQIDSLRGRYGKGKNIAHELYSYC